MVGPYVVPDHGGRDYSPSPNEEIKYKATGDETDGQFDYFELRVGHLEGFPLHIHLEQHETFHVIEGELLLRIDQDYVLAKTGQFVFVPKGLLHTYINLNKQPARTVGLLSPGNFHKFVEEMMAQSKASGGHLSQAQIDEICAKHQQRMVGPPLAVVLGLQPGDPAQRAAVEKGLETLQGRWKMTYHEGRGERPTEEYLRTEEGEMVLDGNKMRLYIKGKHDFEGIAKIDPTQTPNAIDFYYLDGPLKGKTGLGIYEVNGDDLRICWGVAGLRDTRPTEFSNRPGENQAILTYRRETS
jgi:uncharacterized protein (TIGR03067 family)